MQELRISELHNNPWHFRVISNKDFENLKSMIEQYGYESINPIIVAKIDKYYIVDGHARRDAIASLGFEKIKCIKADWITNMHELRVWSFKFNRHGYHNPLLLLDMLKEDMDDDIEALAREYGVSSDYIQSILALDRLDISAKNMIDKVITIASKRYQFALEQINTYGLALIAKLDAKEQSKVLQWIFHDILYGPLNNESIVSIPSIYEIVHFIDKNVMKDNKRSIKRGKRKSEHKLSDMMFVCSCKRRYQIELRTSSIYEYIEHDGLIIKKKVVDEQISSQYCYNFI